MDEVARRLAAVRAASGQWVASKTGSSLSEPWAHEGFAVEDETEAWVRFAQVLNEGLRSFQPRIEFVQSQTLPPDLSALAGEVTIGVPSPDLFAALCRQVFNLQVEDLTPQRCSNETCDNWFVRQRGRAEHGQHRTTGVKYCSVRCARTQAQRELRRRNREAN